MALTALNMSATFFLASKSDPKYDEDIDVARENGATIFEIGYLPKEVCAELQDASQEAVQSIENGISTTYKSKNSQKAYKAFRRGLRGVSNFANEDGQQQPFETENIMVGMGRGVPVASISFVNKFPTSVINEIGGEILKRSTLTDDERKKSDGLSMLLAGTGTSSAASATTNKKPQEDAESLQSDTQDETKTATKKDTGKTP